MDTHISGCPSSYRTCVHVDYLYSTISIFKKHSCYYLDVMKRLHGAIFEGR